MNIARVLKKAVAGRDKPFTIFDLLEVPNLASKLKGVAKGDIHAALLAAGCDTVDEIEGAIFYATERVIKQNRGVYIL